QTARRLLCGLDCQRMGNEGGLARPWKQLHSAPLIRTDASAALQASRYEIQTRDCAFAKRHRRDIFDPNGWDEGCAALRATLSIKQNHSAGPTRTVATCPCFGH